MSHSKATEDFQHRLAAYIEANYDPKDQAELIAQVSHKVEPDYLIHNEDKSLLRTLLDRVLQKKEPTFAEYLLQLIKEKHLAPQDVYKKAGITKALFSKIKNNKDYQPSKDTVIAFIFALQLDAQTADDLLGRAGYAFSQTKVRDLIIQFYVQEGVLDIDQLNVDLYDHGLKPLHDENK